MGTRGEASAGRRIARRLLPGLLLLSALGLSLLGACGYDWTVVPKKTGGKDASVATATCKDNQGCESDDFCVFQDGQCGDGASGTCEPIPAESTCAGEPATSVCACDGQLMTSRCAASAAGLDVGSGTRCKGAPATTFRCGTITCATGSQFCLETKKGGSFSYFCVDWKVCPERNCSCKETAADCSGMCEQVGGNTIMHCL